MTNILNMINEVKEESEALMQTTVRLPRGTDEAITKFCEDTGLKKGMLLRRMIEDKWAVIAAEINADTSEDGEE